MLLRAILTLALSLAAWHGLEAPARAAEASEVTYLGRFRFQPRAAVLMLPVSGPLASLAWDERPRMPAQYVDYLEVPGLGSAPAKLRGGLVRSLNPRHRLVRRILVAQNRPGVVRIAVRGQRAIRLVPDYTRRDGQWYLRVRILPYRGR